MALIRDNRGALLASNLSQYLAGAANTAGTPIDTNEMVRILNQFLGEGEQISSDLTTVTNGIYKKFGAIDKVTNRTEIVTSGIWSGDTGSLDVNSTYTSSTQITNVSGKYYIDVYNTVTTSDAAEVQFSIAYGDIDGFGAPNLQQSDDSTLPTRATYNQYANVLLESGDSYFSVYSGSTAGAHDLRNFYAININRARYKERLDPGNISINLSGSVSASVTLIDDSGGTDENVTTAGRVYNLVEGSLNIGSALTASISSYVAANGQGYGLFYPDMGIILLNPAALASKVDTKLVAAVTSSKDVYHNIALSGSTYSANSGSVMLLRSLHGGADFQVRRTENVSTSHYFVRANNREFNFSNNPTFVSGSVGAFVNSSFEKDPKVYITTVGLYDDGNELLAVAKTSQPIAKSFDKEIAIKVKLDF
jgi:hypothetical protein